MRGGFSRLGAMTLGARYILVEAREREASTNMVKARSRLPRVLIVTTQALGAQLACMGILVATLTLLAQTQEGLANIFDLDFCTRGCGDAGGVVALLTAQLGMLSLESKSGEQMHKFLTIQFGKRELPPVVLHMAASAINLCVGDVVGAGVVAAMLVQAAADFGVTVQTL